MSGADETQEAPVPPDRATYVESARARADALYAGVLTPHLSCGIALAETFGLPTASYQALRKGAITGDGPCGAITAGVLVLGEILGDPDPTGAPTPALREAVPTYLATIAQKIDLTVETSCKARTQRFQSFVAPERQRYCTSIAAVVAETVAEVLWDIGLPRPIPPAPWRSSG